MFLWLLEHLQGLAESVHDATSGTTRIYLTARTAAASCGAFLIALGLGPWAIRWLSSRYRERIDSASQRLNAAHASKQGTPTMGGLFIVAALLVNVLLFGDLSEPCVQVALFLAVGFGAIGAFDDWIKLSTRQRGLTARSKFLGQCALALLASSWLYASYRDVPEWTNLIWPFGGSAISLGLAFLPWSMLVLVGSSNGVNLTDGLDGLATGCLIFAGCAIAVLTYVAGHYGLAEYLQVPFVVGAGEMTVVLGATVGALLGFLWFNTYPAQIFMGDTGSLPLGALLGLAALMARQELLLVVIGGVFVVETLSVILQVGCYKLFGRRVIACSPLHNHFVLSGQPETRIVTRFWIVSALLAILGVASLQIR